MSYLDEDGLTLYDLNIKSYVDSKAGYVPTLSTIPSSSTITYTKNGLITNFNIGLFARIIDSNTESGYRFYQLYDIHNNVATWQEVSPSKEYLTIRVTSNQSVEETTSILQNSIITIKDNNNVVVFSGNIGAERVFFLLPGIEYTITTNSIAGYKSPSATHISLYGGVGTIILEYKSEFAKIYVVPDVKGKGLENNLIVIKDINNNILATGTGTEISNIIKIPFGTLYKAEVTNISIYYTLPTKIETASEASRAVFFTMSANAVDMGTPDGIRWSRIALDNGNTYYSWGNIDGHPSSYDFSSNYNSSKGKNAPSHLRPYGATYDAATYLLGEGWMMPTATEASNVLSSTYTSYSASGATITITSRKNNNNSFSFWYTIPTEYCYDTSSGWIAAIQVTYDSNYNYYPQLRSGGSGTVYSRSNGYRIWPVCFTLYLLKIKLNITDNSLLSDISFNITADGVTLTVTPDLYGNVDVWCKKGTIQIECLTHEFSITEWLADDHHQININVCATHNLYTSVSMYPNNSTTSMTLNTISWLSDAQAGINAIYANSYRCVGTYLNNIMTIKKLDNSNSLLYIDGSDASTDILTVGKNVWMRLPKFYWRCIYSNSTLTMWVAYGGSKPGGAWKEWDNNLLIGVYKACYLENTLWSLSGLTPTRSNSSTSTRLPYLIGIHEVTYLWHCIMALLYYIKYRNKNSQAVIGAGDSTLGKITGKTNSLGMEDTTASQMADGSINFWGLENWWGDLCEHICDLVEDGYTSPYYYVKRIDMEGNTIFRKSLYYSGGWATWSDNQSNYENFYLWPSTSSSATETTYNCDYLKYGYLRFRSYMGNSTYGGISCLIGNYGNNLVIGRRIAYTGEIKEQTLSLGLYIEEL